MSNHLMILNDKLHSESIDICLQVSFVVCVVLGFFQCPQIIWRANKPEPLRPATITSLPLTGRDLQPAP